MKSIKIEDEVTTNLGLPRDLRLRLDEIRLARARRGRCRPPALKHLLVEAALALVEREAKA